MSALHELLKEIPSDYDEVDVANHLLHFREAAAAELAALTQRLEAAEAEREYYKNNASAWKEFAEHMEYCAVCAEDVDNCEDGSLLRSVAKVKIDDVILKGDA